MKKLNFYKRNPLKLLSLTLMATAISGIATAQISFTDLEQRVNLGRISVFDYDGDGDMDIIVSGAGSGINNTQLYVNDGYGYFTPTSSPLDAMVRPTFDWNDINQDGKPDILLNGFNGASLAKIYTTNGSGTFTPSSITLPQIAPTSAFADLNNDGYLDIIMFGNNNIGKSKILFNNTGNGFTESAQFDSYSFVDPQVSVVDYDNDKDLDLFVMASSGGQRFSKLFVNNNGVFTETTITGLFPKGNGSSTWGDYNGDGFPDLLLGGDGFLSSGEDSNNYWLYRNNGDGSFTQIQNFIYRQNSVGGGGKFLDWDNDGDLDIVVTGWSPAQNRQATDIYLNNNGSFTAFSGNNSIPGSSEGAVELGDVDNDGDLDLFVTGYSGNDWDGLGGLKRHASFVVVNLTNNPNAAPTAPTNIAVTGSSTQLNFSWAASTDATTPQQSLTYNLFLVDANGKWFYYPASDTISGKMKTAGIGNVQYNTGWIVKNLPAGNYRWGVQAIDNSYLGSAFTKGSFTINSNGTLPVTISDYKVVKEGNHALIKWTSLSEVSVDQFIIERSLDGKNFDKITEVPATGAGNYSFRDHSPSAGDNYYRLTSIDKDATAQVFDIFALNFQLAQSEIILYPNPLVSSEVGLQLRLPGKSNF